jgi:ATP-binding cassette subfamily B protein/subfamily B ATP-binding cassette protein MsbA
MTLLKSPVFSLIRDGLHAKAGWVLSSLLATTLAAVFEGGTFGVILLALRVVNEGPPAVLGPGAAALNRHHEVFAWIAHLGSLRLFAGLIALAVLLQALRSALTCVGISASVNVGTFVQVRLQRATYAQVMRLSYACASRYRTGDLTDVVATPAVALFEIITIANDFIVGAFTILCYAFLLLKISVTLTAAALLLFGLTTHLQRRLVRGIRDRSVQMSRAGAHVSQQLVETVSALRTIHSFNRQSRAVADIGTTIDEMAGHTRRIHRTIAVLRPLSETLSVAAVGALLIGSFFLLDGGTSTVPQLLVFAALLNRMAGRTTQMMANVADIAKRIGPLQRASEMLHPDDKTFLVTDGKQWPGLHDAIRFESVTLRYENTAANALNEVSFAIPRGTVTALVGGSGAGKSSIADLLLRLYNPTAGRITADDIDIHQYSLASWLDTISVVSQDTFLFGASIRDNIRFGRPNSSDEQVIAASRVANAHGFIETLPCGYDTVVGERGYGLSGGQRQRIALARAVLREPPILILDEATSALDSVSELLIQDALERFSQQRTVLIIAHRLSTVRRAHQILLVENGRVTEQGSHRELIGLGGQYERYWRLQSR